MCFGFLYSYRGWIILLTTDRLMCIICFIKWFQKSDRSLVKTNARSRHSSITHRIYNDHFIIYHHKLSFHVTLTLFLFENPTMYCKCVKLHTDVMHKYIFVYAWKKIMLRVDMISITTACTWKHLDCTLSVKRNITSSGRRPLKSTLSKLIIIIWTQMSFNTP